MSDLFRVTHGFHGKGQGWSETMVYPGVPGTTSGTFYGAVILNIAQKRAALLAREYELTSTRVAKIRLDDGTLVKRNVLLNSTVIPPHSQSASNSGDQPNACAIARTVDISGSDQKDVSLGGIPDDIATNGGGYAPLGAADWGSRFASWAQAVVQAQGGWLADKVNLGPVNLTTYVISPSKRIVLTFDAPLFLIGEVNKVRTIRLKGVNGRSPLNGEQKVIVNSVTECVTVKPLAVFIHSAGGAGTSYQFPEPFVVGVAWGIRKIGTHKRGRPLLATRGRLPARARG